MEEKWLPVFGWENLYQVSDQGRVRSLDRVVVANKKTRWGRLAKFHLPYKGKIMKPNTDSSGYVQVVLQEKSTARKVTVVVHRLVLSAFVRPPEKDDHGMHKNDIRSDNRLSNLQWGHPATKHCGYGQQGPMQNDAGEKTIGV